MSRPRLYADFNGIRESPRDPGMAAMYLYFRGTLADLGRLRLRLSEGLAVDVYSDSDEHEDLEATGVVHFHRPNKSWFVEFDYADLRYVPTRPGSYSGRLPCWSCGHDLAEQVKRDGLHEGDRCGACDARIHAPLDPPDAGV